MKLKLYIRNRQRRIRLPRHLRLTVRKCCLAVLEHEKFPHDAEVSVSFVDDEEIRRLNRLHRHKDKSTDVLSFPLGSDGVYDVNRETGAYMLGDIVISLETALRQAREYCHSAERETGFLAVHSMLHLLGYDHETSEKDAFIMHKKEEEILAELGISRDSRFMKHIPTRI